MGASDQILQTTTDPDDIDRLRDKWAAKVVEMGLQQVWGVEVTPLYTRGARAWAIVLGRHDEPSENDPSP